MRLGFAVPVSGSWATPDNVRRLARRAEELGYESLWTFQRLLYPAAPGGPRWADAYRSVLDPMVTLGHVAAVTERPRLGVAVVNAPFFSPALLAKQATTVDLLSGGRLDLGIGIGWSTEEYAAVGAPFERRGAREEEFVACLKALWTEEAVDFHGEFYEVPAARQDPRPVQRPHPPVLLGGGAEAALRRAGRISDGWISASRADLASLGQSIATVRRGAEEAGRDPAELRFVCRGVVRAGAVSEGERARLSGSYDDIRADLAAIEAQGMTELFVDLNFDPRVGSPDADPGASVALAEEVLEELAPGRS